MKRDIKAETLRAVRRYALAYPGDRWVDGAFASLDPPKQATFDFDAMAGRAAANAGIEQAKKNRGVPYGIACRLAEEIARKDGEVHMDAVIKLASARGMDLSDLGPAAGGVFRDKKKWEFVRWTHSERESNHASDLRVWRLREEWLREHPIT